jgi:DnaJ-class molecular chaperone
MKHPRTLYAILGVTSDADPDVVRAAYRALAKKYHPDAAGKFQMSDLAFRAVAEAYAVLSDVEKRRIYDASLEKLGANTARTFTDEAANTGTRPSRSLSDKLRYGAAALLVFGVGSSFAAAPDADGRAIFLGPLIGPKLAFGSKAFTAIWLFGQTPYIPPVVFTGSSVALV